MTTIEQLIAIYMDRFINRSDIWGRQWANHGKDIHGYDCQRPDMESKPWKPPYEPVTPDLVRRHLWGEVSCAWCAIDENFRSRWLCFDSDKADGRLDHLEAALRSWCIHVIREGRRPGRDGHLWVLFDTPVAADLLILLGDEMMRLAGVSGLERIPKTATGISLARGPLGINLKPEAEGARGLFDGVRVTLKDQLEWLAAQPRNSAQGVIREATKLLAVVAPHRQRSQSREGYGGFDYRDKSADWWQYANQHGFKHSGEYQHGPCPSCRLSGHDRTGNNMWVRSDGAAGCFRGCSYGDIHRAAM